MKAKKVFTSNDAIAMMHKDAAFALNELANYIEKWELDNKEAVAILRECADLKEAQAMVVNLRDRL